MVSLESLLKSAPPSGSYGIVISSAFSSVLDLVEMVLKELHIECVRIDAATDQGGGVERSALFQRGEVNTVLLQQEAALRLPDVDLSRAVACIFYDSGVNVTVCTVYFQDFLYFFE
jgi:hypothetical protein